MKKRDLLNMIAQHTSLRDRVRRQFDHFYDEMSDEERDKWFRDLKLQNEILAWLAEQKPDDE